MPEQFISTLIEAGIAGVFAVFAIFLFREGAKSLSSTQKMFIEFLEAERKQRAEIMMQANKSLVELTSIIRAMSVHEATKPHRRET